MPTIRTSNVSIGTSVLLSKEALSSLEVGLGHTNYDIRDLELVLPGSALSDVKPGVELERGEEFALMDLWQAKKDGPFGVVQEENSRVLLNICLSASYQCPYV